MAVSLPLEIERIIFKLTARTDQNTLPSLVRVSSYVSQWVLPILYEIVIIGWDAYYPPIASLEKYGCHVHHLLIGQGTTIADIAIILISCPNVTNLALWASVDLTQNAMAMEAFKKLPLTRLSIHFDTIFDFTEPLPPQAEQVFSCFPKLTHLDVAAVVSAKLVEFLQYIPSLTYLSLTDGAHEFWQEPSDLLMAFPQLRIIALVSQNVDDSGYSGEIDDDASLPGQAVVSCQMAHYMEDWRNGARGELDVWEYVIDLVDSAIEKRG